MATTSNLKKLYPLGTDSWNRTVFKDNLNKYYKKYRGEQQLYTASGFEGEPSIPVNFDYQVAVRNGQIIDENVVKMLDDFDFEKDPKTYIFRTYIHDYAHFVEYVNKYNFKKLEELEKYEKYGWNGFYHYKKQAILTYTEGDMTLTLCKDTEVYDNKIASMVEFEKKM